VTNNPLVYYKPGLTMDAPVTVTLAAADWAVFMSWAAGVDTTGATHIIHGLVSEQVAEALYDQPSLKAAKAYWTEQQQDPFGILGQMSGLQIPEPFPDNDDDDKEEN
jgi:hypothetical protein